MKNPETRIPRKWNISLTYEPKIEAVKAGTCTQTIRIIGKSGPKQVGDLVSFHGWQGRPYHSPWSWRMPYMEITAAATILIFEWGIENPQNSFETHSWSELDSLAALDGIVPPTGEALRDVLISKNGKIPEGGVGAQVLRWKL